MGNRGGGGREGGKGSLTVGVVVEVEEAVGRGAGQKQAVLRGALQRGREGGGEGGKERMSATLGQL